MLPEDGPRTARDLGRANYSFCESTCPSHSHGPANALHQGMPVAMCCLPEGPTGVPLCPSAPLPLHPWWTSLLGQHVRHMDVTRLGVQLELQVLAYTAATHDPSHVHDLHHSSGQRRIINPLSRARAQTCILRDTS